MTKWMASLTPPNVEPNPSGKVWMPVIPLVGSASSEVPNPKRGTISSDRIKSIADMMLARLDAIKDPLLAGAPMAGRGQKELLAIAWHHP